VEERQDLMALLERIAVALERLADAFPAAPRPAADLAPAAALHADAAIDPEEPEEDAAATLRSFLAGRQITIKRIPPEEPGDKALDQIAQYIGSKLDQVRELLDKIKSTMNNGGSFTLNLSAKPQSTVSSTTGLATNLHNIAFLTEYRYEKAPKCLLMATPSKDPHAINFYSGQWLERYIKGRIVECLSHSSAGYSILGNAQVTLPNGDDFELDMIFEVQGEVFWVEAKTGEYQKHIQKYSKMAKVLGLDRSHAFMVLADEAVTEALADTLTAIFGMTVVPVQAFEKRLAQVLPVPAPA
jgi:hypothetical protein